MLFGRDDEREHIGSLLKAARSSRSGALVIRGEPGIGKSEGAGLTGMFTSETGFTRAFAMGALGGAVTLATSALMPGRTPVVARRIR